MNGTDRLLLTRPLPQSERFAAEAEAVLGAGLRTVIAPLQRIEATGPLPDMRGIDGLILSSESGARSYAALGGPSGLPAWCVGARTQAAAVDAGLIPFQSAADADSLVARLVSEPPAGRLLHLHGHHTAGRIVERLTDAGLQVHGETIYAQVAQPMPEPGQAALAVPGAILVPVFSRRSAQLLLPWLDAARATPFLAAISPAVAEALTGRPCWRVSVAATPDAASVITALSRLRAGESP